MRVLMLESAAGDQHAGLDQGLDYGLVGVALLALVGDDALAGEAGRGLGEAAVGIDGVGNSRVDATRPQLQGCGPNIEVFPAMSRRRVNKTRPRIGGDMIAVQQRDTKRVTEVA